MEDPTTHERELREAWQHAHDAQHRAEAEARRMARLEIDRRLDDMNELRDQINRERVAFLTRDMYDREHTRLRDEFDARVKILENKDSNLQGRVVATGAILAFVLSVLALASRFFI